MAKRIAVCNFGMCVITFDHDCILADFCRIVNHYYKIVRIL